MQNYIPQYFKPQEIFPPRIVEDHTALNGSIIKSIWRLMDPRILWICDQLRNKFGTMIINDYFWKGNYKYRGFRPVIDLINWSRYKEFEVVKSQWSSFTSQHCFGRAIDAKFKHISAEEIRKDIKNNPDNESYKYITAIEDDVDWLHFDCRNSVMNNGNIFYFTI